MKANAPEKIYVHVKNDKVTNIWNSTFIGVRDIEYTRTDAFIEKATLWLLTNADDYCILHNSYDTKGLVKDFVDAMKRE